MVHVAASNSGDTVDGSPTRILTSRPIISQIEVKLGKSLFQNTPRTPTNREVIISAKFGGARHDAVKLASDVITQRTE